MSIVISILFLITASALGLLIWGAFWPKRIFAWFDLVIGSVIGSLFIAYLIFITSWALGQLNFLVNYSILIFILVLSVYKIRGHFHIQIPKKVTKKNLLCVFLFSVIAIYFWSVFSRLLFFENGNLMAGWITVWGDWAAHLSYTTSFAYGNNFPPGLPVYAGQVFSYPFMADFLSAILINLGTELNLAMIIPSFWFTFSSFLLCFYLFATVTKKLLNGLVSTLLFFGNGGLGFIYAVINPNSSELTKIGVENIHWMSVMTSQFIPQRGFAMGFPVALIVFGLLYRIVQGKTQWQNFFLAGLLISLLPLVHMHSFMILVFLSMTLFLFTTQHIKRWLIFAIPNVLLAIPAIYYFYSGSASLNSFRIHLGWLAQTPSDIPLFLLKNFGLMLLLPIAGWFLAPRKLKYVCLPFGLLFILANVFIFQPWDWDNTKFFTYWYVGAALLGGIVIDKFIKSRFPIVSISAILLFVICVLSGMSDNLLLLNVSQNKIIFFNSQQLEAADFIRSHVPNETVFLTADNHDNLVPVLTGRKTVLGYPGWLWSYGVNYWQRQADINLIKTGQSNSKALLTKYGIKYVIIGPVESSQQFNKTYFAANFKQIYKSKDYSIYEVNQ